MDLLAVEASHQIVSSMLSGSNQKISRVFILLRDLPRTRHQQRGKGPSFHNAFKGPDFPVFESGVSERHLSEQKNQRQGHSNQTKPNNDFP
jgi:hypothetical protein